MPEPLWNAKEETLIPQVLFICSLPQVKGTLAGLPFLVTGFKLHKPESNNQTCFLMMWGGEETIPKMWAEGLPPEQCRQ